MRMLYLDGNEWIFRDEEFSIELVLEMNHIVSNIVLFIRKCFMNFLYCYAREKHSGEVLLQQNCIFTFLLVFPWPTRANPHPEKKRKLYK